MDLSDRKDLVWLAVLASDLRKSAPAYEPLVVGATARDLLLHFGLDVPVARATADIDLAFAVRDWDEFSALRENLLSSAHFAPGRPSSHRLVHRGVPVDLIPFNGVENPDGTIVWPDHGSVMGVLGYREAWASSVSVMLPEGQNLLCVSLPMLALLKLLAWEERHAQAPRKDSNDFFLILESYLRGGNAERLYNEAAHLLDADDFDYESAGAWLTGYDAACCIAEYSKRPDRVLHAMDEILTTEADPSGRLQLIGEVTIRAEHALRLLAHFQRGLRYAWTGDPV